MSLVEDIQKVFADAHALCVSLEAQRDALAGQVTNGSTALPDYETQISAAAQRREAARELYTLVNSLGTDAQSLLTEMLGSPVTPLPEPASVIAATDGDLVPGEPVPEPQPAVETATAEGE